MPRKIDAIESMLNDEDDLRRRIRKAVQQAASRVSGTELRKFAEQLHAILRRAGPQASGDGKGA